MRETELENKENSLVGELLLSDDEVDLIWCLPYITDHQKLAAVAKAQMGKMLEVFRKIPDAVLTPAGC